MNSMKIGLVLDAWYRLPDGTRVQARQPYQHWRLVTEDHRPIYEVIDEQVFALWYDTATNTYKHRDSDVQLDDLTLE